MILDDLKSHLVAQSILTSDEIKFNIFDGTENCVILWEYGGLQTPIYEDQVKSIQIKVKNTSMSIAQTKIWAIYNALITESGDKLINSRKTIISANQPPFYLEKDDQNRHTYVFNITLTTTKET